MQVINQKQKAGFTLIELLVVISIILIAASIIFVAGRGGSGAGLSASTRIAKSVLDGARGQAVLRNTEVAVIIYAGADLNSGGDPDKFLRFFGIVEQNPENANEWRATTQGTYLPRGIYFNPERSQSNSGGSWTDGPSNLLNLTFPVDQFSAEGGTDPAQYYVFRFGPNGRALNANASLVLQAGILQVSGGILDVDFSRPEDEFLRSALIIRPAGTVTLVSDPQAISD